MRKQQQQQQQNPGSNSISVTFTLRFANEQSPAETMPSLLCYFSKPIKGGMVEFSLPEDNADQEITVCMQGVLDAREQMPIDAAIMFYPSATRQNDFGDDCRVNMGIGELPLADIINGGGAGGIFQGVVPLKMKSCGDEEKGRLFISATRSQVNIASRIQWESTSLSKAIMERQRAAQLVGDATDRRAAAAAAQLPVEREMIRYINRLMECEMAMPNTFKDTSNVRIPIYYGDFGMMRPDAPLPAAAYFMCDVPASNRAFWVNSLDAVLQREGLVVQDVDRLSLQEQASIMADMLCFLVQLTHYIGDVKDGNKRSLKAAEGFIGAIAGRPYDPTLVEPGERFGELLRDGCGDCEDKGVAIGGQVVVSFWRADFSDHPQLKRLQEIARQYFPVMSLDTVTAAAVTDKEKRKLGAHIKCNFFPAIWVKERLDKGEADLRRSAKLDPFLGEAINGHKDLPWKPFAPWASELEVLIGEGTGMFESRGHDTDYISAERAAVYGGMPSLQTLPRVLVHKPKAESPFFVGSMVGFTPYWFDQGANVAGLWIGYSGSAADKGNQHTMQRGITFKELVNKNSRISFVAHPAFSNDCMDWMRRQMRYRVPPRDLTLTEEGIKAHALRANNAALNELVSFTASMGRPIQYKAQPPVPHYVQESHLNKAFLDSFKTDVRSNKAIAAATYTALPLTDWMQVYRLGISANVM